MCFTTVKFLTTNMFLTCYVQFFCSVLGGFNVILESNILFVSPPKGTAYRNDKYTSCKVAVSREFLVFFSPPEFPSRGAPRVHSSFSRVTLC